MRFLVDIQLPPALARWLESKGHFAEHVSERFAINTQDLDIAAAARSSGAVVISKDADFLDLVTGGQPQFLWVRTGNTTNRNLLQAFETSWAQIEHALLAGDSVVEVE